MRVGNSKGMFRGSHFKFGGDKGMVNLIQKYNYLISRNQRGERFLESDEFFKSTKEEQDKWLRAFIEISRQLSTLKPEIEKVLGRKMTEIEILDGIKEVGGDE